MRIVMLTWEYPPKIVGGISPHVYGLSRALFTQGHEVHVITAEHPGAPAEELVDGVHVYRVAVEGHTDDFIHWVHRLNDAMYIRGDQLMQELIGPPPTPQLTVPPGQSAPQIGAPLDVAAHAAVSGTPDSDDSLLAQDDTIVGDAADSPLLAIPEVPAESWPKPDDPIVLHAHDWLSYFSANGLKHKWHVPLVATIHATEYGRNNGISGPTQSYINSAEVDLTREAWRVIVCTDFMKRECEYALHVPWDKMDIVANGVDEKKFEIDATPQELADFRLKFAAPDEKIVFFVGRMVREKGVQVLIEALPKIRWGYHDTKLLICGGGYKEHLISLAHYVGMERHVYFAGFVPDEELLKIYKIADVACFPSLYEPFGIVALEAMAAHTPVVVSDAGGLPEVVQDQVTGTTTYAGNANSLADGVLSVLHDPVKAKRLADEAFRRVETVFNWNIIAEQTATTYQRVWDEYVENLSW